MGDSHAFDGLPFSGNNDPKDMHLTDYDRVCFWKYVYSFKKNYWFLGKEELRAAQRAAWINKDERANSRKRIAVPDLSGSSYKYHDYKGLCGKIEIFLKWNISGMSASILLRMYHYGARKRKQGVSDLPKKASFSSFTTPGSEFR